MFSINILPETNLIFLLLFSYSCYNSRVVLLVVEENVWSEIIKKCINLICRVPDSFIAWWVEVGGTGGGYSIQE